MNVWHFDHWSLLFWLYIQGPHEKEKNVIIISPNNKLKLNKAKHRYSKDQENKWIRKNLDAAAIPFVPPTDRTDYYLNLSWFSQTQTKSQLRPWPVLSMMLRWRWSKWKIWPVMAPTHHRSKASGGGLVIRNAIIKNKILQLFTTTLVAHHRAFVYVFYLIHAWNAIKHIFIIFDLS